MKNFQIIIVVIFIAGAVLGILVFSGAIPLGKKNSVGGQGTVVLWGTVPSSTIAPALESFNNANPTFVVQYVQKYPETFNNDLLEALASGNGPDMFFLPDDLAYGYTNKIFTIPYSSYPVSAFKNNFAGAGEVFLTSKGILAFPITIDPLVMYYNRTTLDSNNIIYPPSFWEDFANLVPLLTKKDDSNKIIKSAVALGQFSNITNAKEILSTLFMQTGNPIIAEQGGLFIPTLDQNNKYNLGLILKFYTDFADSLKPVYSWNKSLPNSTDAFSKEDLTFYFGFASELKSLINTNPNQNFLATPMPQIKNSNSKLTFGHVTGIAISAFSKNFNTAFTAATLMATGDFASKFANLQGVAPARRDLLKITPTDAYSPVFYSSALYARSFLDPSPTNTDDIFRLMVEKVLSNSMSVDNAVLDTNAKLRLLLVR